MPESNQETFAQTTASFIKFFLGTFMLGYFSMQINADYQQAQLEQKKHENEQKFAQQFLDRYISDKLDNRLQFAQYFACVLGGKWEKYYQELNKEYETKLQKLGELQQKIDAKENLGPVAVVAELASNATETKDFLKLQVQQIKQTAITMPDEKKDLWMYFGIHRDGKWTDRVVSVDGDVEFGKTYSANTEVRLRKAPFDGDIVGLVRSGERVKVLEVTEKKDNNAIWCRVVRD